MNRQNLLGGELTVDPVSRQVICPCGRRPERRVQLLVEFNVVSDLLRRCSKSWSGVGVRACQAALRYELLRLARICFIFYALTCPSDDSVQHYCLFCVLESGPEAVLDGALIVLDHLLFVPVKVVFRTCGGKVVAVHGDEDLSMRVTEYAG